MKAHIAVDAESSIVHAVVATAANVNDVTQAGSLLHGQETDAFGGAGYCGVAKREEEQGPQWQVAMQPGKRNVLSDSTLGQMIENVEKIKASIRAKVEHPFHVVKNLFRHKTASYKGLAKIHAQLLSLFGLANLVIAKRQLLAIHGGGAS
jgi:IS5 family transposase